MLIYKVAVLHVNGCLQFSYNRYVLCRAKEGGKGKGKDLPRTGREGSEGEQMYSSTLPSTSALDGGGWSTPRP